jgi:hypothetical protein
MDRMPRWRAASAVVAFGVACAACGASSAGNAGDASVPPGDDGGGHPADGGTVVGADGSPGCDGCAGHDGGAGTDAAPGADAGTDSGGVTLAGSVLTYHNDTGRTGQYLDETVLTPANVTAATFGKKFVQPVDSYVYAQPLFFPGLLIGGQTHDVVFVVTEANSVYAFDANTKGPVLWHTNVGTALSCSDLDDCGDLVPGAGITGTPVIDASTKTMYLVALSKDSSGSHHRLHALDVTTGAEKLGGPVEVSPTAPGTGANSTNGVVAFNPATHYQRTALLLAGGVVYVGIGSNAESDSDNHGWIVGFEASNLTVTMTFCASPDDDWVSIWQTGGGLASDTAGFIYAETANGTFDADTGGRDYGDSAIKLDSTGAVVDYFTPYDQADLSSGDLDFGSANPVLLPDQSGGTAHELLASGKPGVLYLVDRDAMGHFHAGSDSQIVQSVPAFPNASDITGGIFMSPAYWNGRVYVAGIGGSLEAYTLSAGLLSTSPESQTQQNFGWPGANVSVSASGATAGIVWLVDGERSVLYAYDATNLVSELYDSGQAAGARDKLGSAVKFAVPTVAGGHVFVGTQTELDVYGLSP